MLKLHIKFNRILGGFMKPTISLTTGKTLVETDASEKLLPSVINVWITYLLSIPIEQFIGLEWRLSWVIVFFIYNLACELCLGKCIGMIMCRTYYEKDRTKIQRVLYFFLYSLSFASLLFHVFFPLDLAMMNFLFLQIPFILKTGNTAHGFAAGKVATTRYRPK